MGGTWGSCDGRGATVHELPPYVEDALEIEEPTLGTSPATCRVGSSMSVSVTATPVAACDASLLVTEIV